MTRPGALVATFVALVLALAAPGAGAAGPGTTTSTAPATTTTTTTPGTTTPGTATGPLVTSPALRLRAQTPYVAPTGTLSLQLGIEQPPADAVLSLELMFPITSANDARVALNDYAADRGANRRLLNPLRVPLSFVPQREDGTYTVDVGIAEEGADPPAFGFVLGDTGVYPLRVSLATGEDQAEVAHFTTYLVILPATSSDLAPVRLATVVPFRAPLAYGADQQVHLDDTTRRRLDRLERATRGHGTLPVTIAPDPETIDALALSPDPATPNLQRSELAATWRGMPIVSSTYVPLDVNAWATPELIGEVHEQRQLGTAVLSERLQPTRPLDTRSWPLDAGTSSAAIAGLAGLGWDHLVASRTAVAPLDPRQYKPEQAQIVALEPFDLDTGDGRTHRSVTTDELLRERLSATDDAALSAQLAIADLAVSYFGPERPIPASGATPGNGTAARTLVLVAPEDEASIPALDAFLDALETPVDPAAGGKAFVRPMALDELFTDVATVKNEPLTRAYIDPPAAPAPLGTYPEQLAAARVSLASYRSMVETTEPERVVPLERLLAVSPDRSLDGPARQAYLDAVTGTVGATLLAIHTLPQERVTLAATDAELRLQLENANTFPLAVRVTLSSDKLDFPDGSTFVTTLQPGTNKIPVHVHTRASGDITVVERVDTPDGRELIGSTRFTVRSTAVSGIGLVLSIGAGFFLLVWWARNFRNARRARKLVDLDEGGADGTEGTAGGTDPPGGGDGADGVEGTDPTTPIGSGVTAGDAGRP